MPPGNFILHALKCVLGAPFVHVHSTYIPASCLLRLVVSDPSVMYRALASGLRSSHVR